MEYSIAIEKLINSYKLDILDNTFLSRSILLDYIGNSIYDKKLVDVFYYINKTNNIKNIFINSSLHEGRKILEGIYQDHKNDITKQEFVDAINPISKIIYPVEYEEYIKNKVNNKVLVNKVVVKKKKEEPVVKATPKPIVLNPPPKQTTPKQVKKKTIQKISVKLYNNKLEIYHHDKKDIEIYIDNKLQKLSNYQVINQDTYLFDFSNKIGDIIIYLPNKMYNLLEIEANSNCIVLGKNSNNLLKVRKIIINSRKSYLTLYCKTLTMNINTRIAIINIYSILKNLKIYTFDSSLYFDIDVPYDKGSIHIDGFNVRITGKFKNGKLIPKLNKFLFMKKNIRDIYYSGNTELKLDIKTKVGSIKIE